MIGARGIEHRLLRLLHVFVVGKRKSFHARPAKRWRRRARVPPLPRTSSSRSAFFFCGIALLPVEYGFGQ